MTNEEHRKRAEELIADVDQRARTYPFTAVMTEVDRERVMLAQVHALLSLSGPRDSTVGCDW